MSIYIEGKKVKEGSVRIDNELVTKMYKGGELIYSLDNMVEPPNLTQGAAVLDISSNTNGTWVCDKTAWYRFQVAGTMGGNGLAGNGYGYGGYLSVDLLMKKGQTVLGWGANGASTGAPSSIKGGTGSGDANWPAEYWLGSGGKAPGDLSIYPGGGGGAAGDGGYGWNGTMGGAGAGMIIYNETLPTTKAAFAETGEYLLLCGGGGTSGWFVQAGVVGAPSSNGGAGCNGYGRGAGSVAFDNLAGIDRGSGNAVGVHGTAARNVIKNNHDGTFSTVACSRGSNSGIGYARVYRLV